MNKVILVTAITLNHAIGKDGGLCVVDSRDLKHFKELTSGYPCIMGKDTYKSLPAPLANRLNIVLSKSMDTPNKENVVVVNKLASAIKLCRDAKKIFIIGGHSVYKEALEKGLVDELCITTFNTVVTGDTFFPPVDFSQWEVIAFENHKAMKGHRIPFKIERLVKKK